MDRRVLVLVAAASIWAAVSAVSSAQQPAPGEKKIWDGVYTSIQAARGKGPFRNVVGAVRVQAKYHRAWTHKHPQPPTVPRLAFLDDEDQPPRFVGSDEGRLRVAVQERLV